MFLILLPFTLNSQILDSLLVASTQGRLKAYFLDLFVSYESLVDLLQSRLASGRWSSVYSSLRKSCSCLKGLALGYVQFLTGIGVLTDDIFVCII